MITRSDTFVHSNNRLTAAHAVFALSLLAAGSLPWLLQCVPLLDYPNWLAEAYIIGKLFGGASDYASLWSLGSMTTPNIFVPILMGFWSQFMPIETVGKLMLCIYLIGFPIALLTISKNWDKGHAGGGLIAVIWVFNWFFYQGNLSYLISIMLAFFAVKALDIWIKKGRVGSMMAFASLSLVCYLTHLMGYIVVIVAVFCLFIQALRNGLRNRFPMLFLTQVPSISFLIHYAFKRTDNSDVNLQFYESLANKVFSLIEPFFVTIRLSPIYESPYTTIINMVVIFCALTCLSRTKQISRSYISLAGILLVILGILIPLSWFGGMIRPDERLIFSGVLLVLSQIRIAIPLYRLKLYMAAVLLLLFTIVGLQFSQVQSAFANIQAISKGYLTSHKSIVVIAIMRPSLWNSCTNSWGNFGSVGSFPMLRAPFYSAIRSEQTVYLSLFRTSLIQPRKTTLQSEDQSITLMQFSSPDALQHDRQLNQLAVGPDRSVIAFGCSSDLDRIDTFINPNLTRTTQTGDMSFLRTYDSQQRLALLRTSIK
jgi:hypothetical protein